MKTLKLNLRKKTSSKLYDCTQMPVAGFQDQSLGTDPTNVCTTATTTTHFRVA
jgi:hypothetical protein